MWKLTFTIAVLAFAGTSCQLTGPALWEGPVLAQPRTDLTVDELHQATAPEFLDMSFFARPRWADETDEPFSGSIRFSEITMGVPKDRPPYENENRFPAVSIDFIAHDQELIPRARGLVENPSDDDRYWELIVGTGAVWHEAEDGPWSRASFPLQLVGRYVGEVRNCVATFVYKQDEISNVALQCSQETAVADAGQIGDIRALLPATFEPRVFPDAENTVSEWRQFSSQRIPTAPLRRIDRDNDIADHFEQDIWTNASTSLGAVYHDGTLYVHPSATRHGTYPYPEEMRHGVFSVTKSMAGSLAMFYFAQRYGESVFDEPIADYVPALTGLPEWEGVTFSHALNMVTGTRAGESGELLYYPLELAPDSETAIRNIAAFGDFPEAPGERFNYATTNTFVLSYALERYVQAKEGTGVHYWDLVRDNVLTPIGAEDFGVLHTRDADASTRVPILGLGAYPTLDNAAKIAVLIANEGQHNGSQLLNRTKIREALGRTGWDGYSAFSGLRYSHSFWSKTVAVGWRRVRVSFMEGLGDNRVVFFPNGALSFQFTDEFDDDLGRLVRAVQGATSAR